MELISTVTAISYFGLMAILILIFLASPFILTAKQWISKWQMSLSICILYVLGAIKMLLNILGLTPDSSSVLIWIYSFALVVNAATGVIFYLTAAKRASKEMQEKLDILAQEEKLKNDFKPVSIGEDGELVYPDEQEMYSQF